MCVPVRPGPLYFLSPAAMINGVLTGYRAYRDWWRALELRRPGGASLMQAAAMMLGVVVGLVLFAPSLSSAASLLAGSVIGVTIGVSWQYHRRKKAARTG
jgi:hypothetical protein